MRAMLIFSIVALTVAGLLAMVWASRSDVVLGPPAPHASQPATPARAPSKTESNVPAHTVEPGPPGVPGTSTHAHEPSALDASRRLTDGYLLLLVTLGHHGARGSR